MSIVESGDYYEGVEEGYAIGWREAVAAAAAAAAQPAGNNMLDFAARQNIIVQRVRGVAQQIVKE